MNRVIVKNRRGDVVRGPFYVDRTLGALDEFLKSHSVNGDKAAVANYKHLTTEQGQILETLRSIAVNTNVTTKTFVRDGDMHRRLCNGKPSAEDVTRLKMALLDAAALLTELEEVEGERGVGDLS